jgi:hypothetical protein
MHGKRAIIDPMRTLSAQELKTRICAYFDCPLLELLAKSGLLILHYCVSAGINPFVPVQSAECRLKHLVRTDRRDLNPIYCTLT